MASAMPYALRVDALGAPDLVEIEAAARRLAGVVLRTPLVPLGGDDEGDSILLKCENLQPVGSFKLRGVFNAVACMTPATRSRGLATVSAGNTAKALAWTARRFGVSARSLMPEHAPAAKVATVRAWGGEPVLVPVAELFRFLVDRGWEAEPYAFVHPWIERDVVIGHGTLGLELAEDLPDVETVFIPVGGGGLCAGVASAIKQRRPGVRIVAVEPEACPSLYESLRRGKPSAVECAPTLCDGVAVPYITEEMFPLLRTLVDEAVLVRESDVVAAIRRVALSNHLIVEGSAALSVAAAVAMPASRRGKSVALLTGGSIEPATLAGILSP